MDEMKKITGVDVAVAEICTALKTRREDVVAAMQPYVNGCVTADTLKDWKTERANINKSKAAVEGERKDLEKEWKSKLTPVSDAYKAISAEYQKAIDNIDHQLSEFEDQRKAEKKDLIIAEWKKHHTDVEPVSWLSLDDVFNFRWLNATYTMQDISKEMQDAVANIQLSYDSIKSMPSVFVSEGLKVLRDTKDFRAAVSEINNLQRMQDAIEAKRQIEEAARKKEEEERKEAEKQEEIRKAVEAAVEAERAKIVILDDSQNIEISFTDTSDEIEFRLDEELSEEECSVYCVSVKKSRIAEFEACMESYGFEIYWRKI